MNRHVLAPLGTALDRVAAERREVDAERDAFAAFAARVDARSPRSRPTVTTAPDPRASVRTAGIATDAAATPTARLRAAYRETVMSVDHYDAVYDESLAVNVANELGADIATALCEDAPFTPTFKRTLYETATTARAERERFVEVLDRERRSLADARSDLEDVVTAMRRHDESRNRSDDSADAPPSLAELACRCERVGRERQRVVQRQLRFARVGDDLYDYLYGDRSWTYPVLSVVATLGEDLSAMRGDDQ
jgi:hypothetical protein